MNNVGAIKLQRAAVLLAALSAKGFVSVAAILELSPGSRGMVRRMRLLYIAAHILLAACPATTGKLQHYARPGRERARAPVPGSRPNGTTPCDSGEARFPDVPSLARCSEMRAADRRTDRAWCSA